MGTLSVGWQGVCVPASMSAERWTGAPGGPHTAGVRGQRQARNRLTARRGPARRQVSRSGCPGIGWGDEAPEAGWAQPPLPIRWDRGSGPGGSAGRGRTAQEWRGVGRPCPERRMAPLCVLWQPGTCWPPAPQPARLPRSQGWETAWSQRWGLARAVAGLRRGPLFCPQGPRGGLWFLGKFSAWPADLKQMTASHRASISLCVKWGNSSTRRGGTPREMIHLKLLAEFTPSGAVCPGSPWLTLG